jgi:hypothetical protein
MANYPTANPSNASNKGSTEDPTASKFSFPAIHRIHADRSNRQIVTNSISFVELADVDLRCAAEAADDPDAQEPHY